MREADRCLAGSGDRQRFLELYYSIIIIKRQQQTRSEYFRIRKTDFKLKMRYECNFCKAY